MKCTIPEISWHNRDPVLSVDIQPTQGDKNEFQRLASGGTDSHVLIWYMTLNESGSINLDLAADLTRHQRAVNVVKWSPNGELLASGDDESVIFIWKLKSESEPLNIVDTTNEQDKEIWITLKILRGHMEDVYDLSWCPNSQFLVSGSVDNTAMIWDVHKGKSMSILNDHKGFVQGVAWDPKNQYIATLSTDRYLRIFDIQTKKVVSRSSKCTLPVPEGSELYGKTMRIYHDDTLQTFFRRLCFSPDGKLIIAPCGVTDYDGAVKPIHTTYIYSRYSLKQPSIVLPSPDQYTVAVKCCPKLFKLRPHKENNPPAIPLPYRMIFAVATKSSVYLYDTQQKMPFGIISNIHYTRLTDLTWSGDGKILIVSSTDGFCSLITFSDNELGEFYTDNSGKEDLDGANKNEEVESLSQKSNLSNKRAKEEISNTNKKESSNSKETDKKVQNQDDDVIFVDVEMKPVNSKAKVTATTKNSKNPKDKDVIIVDDKIKCVESERKDISTSDKEANKNSKNQKDEVLVDVEMKSIESKTKDTPISDQEIKPKTSKSKGPNRIEVRRKPRSPQKCVSNDRNVPEKSNESVSCDTEADCKSNNKSNEKTTIPNEVQEREIIESKVVPFPDNSKSTSKEANWIEIRRAPRVLPNESNKESNDAKSLSDKCENKSKSDDANENRSENKSE